MAEHGCVLIGARLRGHRGGSIDECKDELADAGARYGLESVCFLPAADLSSDRSQELGSSSLSRADSFRGCFLAVMSASQCAVDSAVRAFGFVPHPHQIRRK